MLCGMSSSNAALWALCAYFNPFQGPLRLQNYRHFRARLGVPLITAEWSPSGEFELQPGDAEILLRFSGGDILWQKDRLLNLALPAVPAECEALAVLDADILFSRDDWAPLVLQALQQHPVVQVFEQVHYLAPEASALLPGTPLAALPREVSLPSMASALREGPSLYSSGAVSDPLWRAGEKRLRGNPGLGMAFRAELIRRIGFYDANAIGGADLVMSAVLADRLDELFAIRDFTPGHAQHVRAWAAQARAVGLSHAGVVPVELYHLWHGKLEDRRYASRWQILCEHNFDPARHLQATPQGPWRWSDEADALKQDAQAYLQSRRDA